MIGCFFFFFFAVHRYIDGQHSEVYFEHPVQIFSKTLPGFAPGGHLSSCGPIYFASSHIDCVCPPITSWSG